MNKKLRIFVCVGACLGLLLLAGCATGSLGERTDVSYKSIPIDQGNPNGPRAYALGGEIKGGPMTPNTQSLAIGIDLGENPIDRLQSQRTTRLPVPALPVAANEILSKPPKKSPRGDKAAIIPEQKVIRIPEQVQVIVVDEMAWFPRFMPMGFTGATFEGWFVGWVRSLLSNAPAAFTGAFAPGTNVTAVGKGGAGGKGGSATGGNAIQWQQMSQQQQQQMMQQMQQQQ